MADENAVREELRQLDGEVRERQERMRELRRSLGPQPVEDHVLKGPEEVDVPLSSLFGEKHDLIVIHNMGSSCPYCTLWADGFVGLLPHLQDRAAVVLVSPDEPAKQAAFAESRGWPFRMLSNADSGFTEAMGFAHEQEGKTWFMPGYSTFRRQEDGSVVRVAHDFFGPGDVYCGLWHMLGLLHDGADGWQPKFRYE